MGVSTRQLGQWTVVGLTGAVDMRSASAIRSVFRDLVDSGVTRVLVDLTDVTWVDAVSVGVLIGGYRRVHGGGGDFRVAAPSWPIRNLLRMTGLTRFVPVYDSMATAEADLGP
jgi:anti-sigma B factor antagonist